MDDWMKKAWYFQQELYMKLGQRYWDVVEDEDILQKIEYAFFLCYGEMYSTNQRCINMRKRVIDRIQKHYGSSLKKYFSCTFINLWIEKEKQEGIHCVFWACTNSPNSCVCFDVNGRVYKDWKDFIKNNELPKCYIMYPKNGRYADESHKIKDFADVLCEESEASSTISSVKNSLDAMAGVATAASTIILCFNPVSGPIIIGAAAAGIVGGVVSTGFATDRLINTYQHEGLNSGKAKTLFAVADVTINAFGTVAIGSKLLVSRALRLSESASALRLVRMNYAFRVVTGISATYYVYDLVNKFNSKELNNDHIMSFGRILHFMFNIAVDICLIWRLVQFLSCQNTEEFSENLIRCKDNVFSFFREVRKYTEDIDFEALLNYLLPLKNWVTERLTILEPLESAFRIIRKLDLQNAKNPIALLRRILCVMPLVLQEIDRYLNHSQKERTRRYDKNVCKMVEQWTSKHGIDFNDKFSFFDSKLNFPAEVRRKVRTTLTLVGKNDNKDLLLRKENLLMDTVLKMLLKHDLRDYDYAANKVSFYCDQFSKIYLQRFDSCHCEYYLYTSKCKSAISKNEVFQRILNYSKQSRGIDMSISENLVNFIFNESCNALFKDVDRFHLEYDQIFEENYVPNSTGETNRLIYKLQMPKGTTLNEQVYYDTAIKYFPNISNKITRELTKFEHHVEQLAIITSINDGFQLIFYTSENEDNLDCLIIYTKRNNVS